MDTDYSSVLIATPTHVSKLYALGRWLESVGQFPCPTLLVDNSPTPDFYDQYRARVPMVHLDLEGTANQRIAASMEWIRQYCLQGNYAYWWSLEADMVVPPETLSLLLSQAQDFTSVPYPSRTTGELLTHSFGCTLLGRKLLRETHFHQPADWEATTDAWYQQQIRGKYKVKVVSSAVKLIHLAERQV